MSIVNGSNDESCGGVRRALVAYAHGQLGAAERVRVDRHVRECSACRAALAPVQRIAGDLRREMPRIGQPAPGQMMALWPSIRAQIRVANRGDVQATSLRRLSLNPASGVALAGALMCVFLFSVMMYTPASAVGAPVPPVPAGIQATPTPFTTSAPGGEFATRAVASASLTATLAPSMPVVPAAPEAFVRTLDAPEDASR